MQLTLHKELKMKNLILGSPIQTDFLRRFSKVWATTSLKMTIGVLGLWGNMILAGMKMAVIHNETYFGVNARQSAASGLSRYTADAGLLSYGVSGSVVVALTKHVSTL
jgi:outer membrane scaffolding protein for murein synthesis (MipA/OmpV family)